MKPEIGSVCVWHSLFGIRMTTGFTRGSLEQTGRSHSGAGGLLPAAPTALDTSHPPASLPAGRLAGHLTFDSGACHASSLAWLLAGSVAQHHSFWLRNSAPSFPIGT